MKRILLFLLIVVSFLNESCIKKKSENCTSGYRSELRIDGKKGEEISIQYIGPKKRGYERGFQFGLTSSEDKLPSFKILDANTICETDDFEKHNYDFLKIRNLGTEDVYICSIIMGEEIVNSKEKIDRYYSRIYDLLHIYGKQDQDPTYDYTKDKEFKNVKYIDRYKLYEQLLKEKYPYIIKLPPQKTCIMKWGGLGFEVL